MTIESVGRRRINAAAMVRTVLKVQFEREQELTYAHVRDFLRGAPEMADKGIIDRDRALYLSIGVAAQFELMLRQGDIIGKWQSRKLARCEVSGQHRVAARRRDLLLHQLRPRREDPRRGLQHGRARRRRRRGASTPR
ncbi:hypothetical protein ACVIIW_005460 [Bradyrhizobium sp. USDA 4449]